MRTRLLWGSHQLSWVLARCTFAIASMRALARANAALLVWFPSELCRANAGRWGAENSSTPVGYSERAVNTHTRTREWVLRVRDGIIYLVDPCLILNASTAWLVKRVICCLYRYLASRGLSKACKKIDGGRRRLNVPKHGGNHPSPCRYMYVVKLLIIEI